MTLHAGAATPTIGASVSGATAGSIFFAGTGGTLSENNASFFWDNVNARMAMGISTFTVDVDRLYVMGSAANKEIVVVDSPAGQTTDLQSWRVNNVVVADVTSTGAIETQNGITFDIPSGNCSLAQISAPKSGSLQMANKNDSTNGNVLFNAYTTSQIINQFNSVTKSWFDTSGLYFNNAQTISFNNSTGTMKAAIRGQSDNYTGIISLGSGIKFWSNGFGSSQFEMSDSGQSFLYTAVSPAQIVANTDNYSIAGGVVFRLSTDAARNITGIVPNTALARLILIQNVGSFNIVLQNQNAGSTAANRIITGTGADLTLATDQSVWLCYDGTTQRWRVTKNA